MTKKEQFWDLIGKIKAIKPNVHLTVGQCLDDKNNQPYFKLITPISKKTYRENFKNHDE